MLSSLIDVRYCYDLLISQIPTGLLLYSHIPTAIVAILFASFLFVKTRKTSISSTPLLFLCVSFAIWCFLDLGAWFAFLGSEMTMFTWSLIDIFSVSFFFFSYYFLYTFIKGRDLPLWQKIAGLVTLIPNVYLTLISANLSVFDLNWCEAIETNIATNFAVYIEQFYLLLIIGFTIKEYIATKERELKNKIALAGAGVTIFLFIFFLGLFLEIIVSNFEILQFSYNVEIYGLFGMPIMLIYLGFLIVRYHAFNLKTFTAQAFVIALIALVAAQFAFLHDLTSIILNTVTFILVSWVGISLSRNVKIEIELREKNEALAKNLQVANTGQENLIHIMNHQIKGYLSKARNIFAELLSEDEYKLDAAAKPLVDEGMNSVTEGVDFVQQILKGSSAESGKMNYEMKSINFKSVVEKAIEEQDDIAKTKKLTLEFKKDSEDYPTMGDSIQLTEVVKNVINNSINYTESGSISLELMKKNGKALLAIKDTGVGITKEDMTKLFTKGGRGKDSLKYNVNSTGYGLAFAKAVIDAHKGKIWAESAGQGKGSTFYIELPLA